MFVYEGIDKPDEQPIPKINKETFCNTLDYFSPYVWSFVQWYFDKCHWKGHGLGWYEQGPRHVIDIYYQMPIDKTWLGYKRKMKYNSNKHMIELQPENLTYEQSLHLYHLLKSNDDSMFDKLIPNYLFNNDISIDIVQIEQVNTKNIKPISL